MYKTMHLARIADTKALQPRQGRMLTFPQIRAKKHYKLGAMAALEKGLARQPTVNYQRCYIAGFRLKQSFLYWYGNGVEL